MQFICKEKCSLFAKRFRVLATYLQIYALWGGTCDFDDAAAGEQYIGALEVTVHDVVGVDEVTGAKGEQSRVEQKKDTRHERDRGGGGG